MLSGTYPGLHEQTGKLSASTELGGQLKAQVKGVDSVW